MQLAFSEPRTSEVDASAKQLYCARNPFFPLAYASMGAVMLSMALFDRRISGIVDRLFFAVAAVALFVVAFALPQIWWLWWRPRMRRLFGTPLTGEVTNEGFRVTAGGDLVPWSVLFAAKISDECILLYFDKARAVPLHLSMFVSQADWESVKSHVAQHVRRTSRHSQPSRA